MTLAGHARLWPECDSAAWSAAVKSSENEPVSSLMVCSAVHQEGVT